VVIFSAVAVVSLACAAASSGDTINFMPWDRAFQILSGMTGFLGGIGQCLLVGRIGSKMLDPGSLVLGVLYFYACIQPVSIFFGDETVAYIATTMALPLKALLYFVLVWAFTSGRLFEYVQQIRRLLLQRQSD
jgi:hypothetical protein